MEKVAELLGALAEQLGTTAAKLWSYWLPYCVADAEYSWLVYKKFFIPTMIVCGIILLLALFKWIFSNDDIDNMITTLFIGGLIIVMLAMSGGACSRWKRCKVSQKAPEGFALRYLLEEVGSMVE